MSQSPRSYYTARSTGSRDSEDSQDSQSTAPTSFFSSPSPSIHYEDKYDLSPGATLCPRSSTETYDSSVDEEEEFFEEPEEYDPEYLVPEYQEVVETDLRPTSPSDFAKYFPSTRRLYIRHDDTTYDGNYNLRVDTEADGRRRGMVQLFHLRMQDLKKREFSLRRYERSSGREVCHSSRKYGKPASEKRPTMARSVSAALANIVKPEFKRTSSGLPTHNSKGSKSRKSLHRQDSGYASQEEEPKTKASLVPTNTTKLEFSNYAQVQVKRRGAKTHKRYEFEYWGNHYTWKRVVKKDGYGQEISYHLFKDASDVAVAHIVPELRSPSQLRYEDMAGKWVPPCSMWISDPRVWETLHDCADVIIATGLIALVDDCIKRRFHTKKHPVVPLPFTQTNMEFVTPKAMVEYMFKRRNSSGSSKEKEREQKSSPLRFSNQVEAY